MSSTSAGVGGNRKVRGSSELSDVEVLGPRYGSIDGERSIGG